MPTFVKLAGWHLTRYSSVLVVHCSKLSYYNFNVLARFAILAIYSVDLVVHFGRLIVSVTVNWLITCSELSLLSSNLSVSCPNLVFSKSNNVIRVAHWGHVPFHDL